MSYIKENVTYIKDYYSSNIHVTVTVESDSQELHEEILRGIDYQFTGHGYQRVEKE